MSKNMAEEYMALNADIVEPELNQLGKADDFMDTFHKLRGESASDADGRCRALEAHKSGPRTPSHICHS